MCCRSVKKSFTSHVDQFNNAQRNLESEVIFGVLEIFQEARDINVMFNCI